MTFIDAHCPACGRGFRESANRLCEGQTLSCPHCGQGWALSARSPFDEIVRLLRSAEEARQSFFEPRVARGGGHSNRWYA